MPDVTTLQSVKELSAGERLVADPLSSLPRFTLGKETSASAPLVLSDQAFLYVATGNDTAEYAESYGVDATVLHYLHGAHSLIFTRSVDSAREIEQKGRRAVERMKDLNAQTYKLPLPGAYDQQEFVIWSGETVPSESGVARAAGETWELAHQRRRNPEHFTAVVRNARFNQLTSIQIRHIAEVMQKHPEKGGNQEITSDDLARLEQIADQAVVLNNKAAYYDLTRGMSEDIPRHVPTAVIPASELYTLMGAEDPLAVLQSRLGISDGAVVIKSAVEAGGECCVILRGEGDNVRLAELMSDLLKKGRNLEKTDCLVQRCVTPATTDMPARIGILGYVGPGGYLEASTQLYSDPDRRTYLGSYWSDSMSQESLSSVGPHKIYNLLEAFKKTGYVGPLGLDAMLDADGDYTLIYDANPRLTSAAAVLMMRDAVRGYGVRVESAASLGHHGNWEFEDLSVVFKELDRLGAVFSIDSGRGVVLTPNPRGDHRFDVYCINMTPPEIQEAFGALARNSSDAPAGLYF